MTKETVIQKMLETYQTSGCNMLQHGQQVQEQFKLIKKTRSHLPSAIQELYLSLENKILPESITDIYQLYHDCGKPFVREEIDGKISYPDHAKASAEIWLSLDEPNKELLAELMLHDMDFHVMRGEDVKNLWQSNLAPTLYFTAWAELFANAAMFGGIESTSFKIKKKRLISAAKLIN